MIVASERRAVIFIGLFIVAYTVFVLAQAQYFSGNADSVGYLNHARLLAEGHLHLEVEHVRALKLDDAMINVFTPFGFVSRPDATIVPLYPPGLPVHIAAAAAIGGWRIGPFVIVPLIGVGCLLLTIAVGRELGLSWWWTFGAVAILAFSPVFLYHALQPVSDVAATFWALAAMWCGLRASRHPGWAVAAGVSFAIGVWVRPASIILALPLAFAMRWRIKPLVVAALCAIPFGLGLMAYNANLYGNPFTTGYGEIEYLFGWEPFRECMPAHLRFLWQMLTPFAALGLLIPFDRRVSLAGRATLVSWFATVFVFYFFYDVCDGWWATRFLLPGIPALILAFVLVLRHLAQWRRAATVAAVLLIIGMTLHLAETDRRLRLLRVNENTAVIPQAIAWAERVVPRDAFVLTGSLSGPTYFYRRRITARWDEVTPERQPTLRAATRGRPWYAVLDKGDLREDFHGRVGGRWTQVATFHTFSIWRLEE